MVARVHIKLRSAFFIYYIVCLYHTTCQLALLTAGSNLLQRATYLDEKQRFRFLFLKRKTHGKKRLYNWDKLLIIVGFVRFALLTKLFQVTMVTLLGYHGYFVAKCFGYDGCEFKYKDIVFYGG